MILPPRAVPLAVQAVLAVLFVYALTALRDLAAAWGVSPWAVAVAGVWIAAAALGLPILRRVPRRARLAALAVSAIALRIVFALLSVHRTSTGDPNSYLELAKTLLERHELGIWEPWFGGYWRALFPPLYPLLLAGWGALAGFSTPSLLALNTLTDVAAAWLIVRLGTALGRPGAGRGAAWLYLIWPSVLFSAPLAQKESLVVVLVMGLAYAWCRAQERWRDAAAIGGLAGLLALTQPGEAPLAALFGLAMLGRLQLWRILGTGLRALPFAVAVMLPWLVRNFVVLHAFVPLTSAGGASLWIGNNPDATGNWEPPPPELRGTPELAYGKAIGGIAVRWIREHPAAFVHLSIAKLLRAAGIGVFGVTRLEAMRPPLALAVAGMLWPLAQGLHAALLATGTWAARRRDALPLVLIVAACIAQWLLFGIWFEFGERHREFATPFLLLLVCWGWSTVGKDAPTP